MGMGEGEEKVTHSYWVRSVASVSRWDHSLTTTYWPSTYWNAGARSSTYQLLISCTCFGVQEIWRWGRTHTRIVSAPGGSGSPARKIQHWLQLALFVLLRLT